MSLPARLPDTDEEIKSLAEFFARIIDCKRRIA